MRDVDDGNGDDERANITFFFLSLCCCCCWLLLRLLFFTLLPYYAIMMTMIIIISCGCLLQGRSASMRPASAVTTQNDDNNNDYVHIHTYVMVMMLIEHAYCIGACEWIERMGGTSSILLFSTNTSIWRASKEFLRIHEWQILWEWKSLTMKKTRCEWRKKPFRKVCMVTFVYVLLIWNFFSREWRSKSWKQGWEPESESVEKINMHFREEEKKMKRNKFLNAKSVNEFSNDCNWLHPSTVENENSRNMQFFRPIGNDFFCSHSFSSLCCFLHLLFDFFH